MLGDVTGLSKATNRAGKDLGLLGKTTNKVSKGMKSALAGVGLGLSFGGIVSYLKNAAEGAELARQADARVLQVAKSMKLFGGATEATTIRLSKYADQMELTTGQTAEVTKQTQATLLTFASVGKTANKVGGIFDRATQAAADLAATGFGSAETNAIQLGKALNDPIKGITALAKAGVTFTEKEKARIKTLVTSNRLGEAQNLVLKAIETQVGDVAEKTALSSVKLQNALGQVSDEVGAVLLPYLDKLAKWVTSKDGQAQIKKLAGELINLVKEAGKFAKWALDNKGAVMGIVGAIAALKIGSSVITGYRTLLALWQGLVKAGKLIRPPATGGGAPGLDVPGTGVNQYRKPIGPKAPSKPFALGGAVTVAGAAAAAVAVYGSTMVDLYNKDKKAYALEVAAQVKRAKDYSPNGMFSATDLLTGGASGVKRGTVPSFGGSNMSNVTYKVVIENNNNTKITGREIIESIKQEARRRGQTSGVYNLGSL